MKNADEEQEKNRMQTIAEEDDEIGGDESQVALD